MAGPGYIASEHQKECGGCLKKQKERKEEKGIKSLAYNLMVGVVLFLCVSTGFTMVFIVYFSISTLKV